MKRVLKWDVPVDSRFHDIGAGKVIHVGVQLPQQTMTTVQVWTEEDENAEVPTREAIAFGTGQDIPNELLHAGTTLDGPFVWHIYAKASPSWWVRT